MPRCTAGEALSYGLSRSGAAVDAGRLQRWACSQVDKARSGQANLAISPGDDDLKAVKFVRFDRVGVYRGATVVRDADALTAWDRRGPVPRAVPKPPSGIPPA